MQADIGAIQIIEARFEDDSLRINPELLCDWLVKFLRHECIERRGYSRAVLGLSGGLDSAVTAHLCARAFGPENTHAFRLPYKLSSAESAEHARLVIDQLGINEATIEITEMVDGYLANEPGASPSRIGNICARMRMVVLFDQSAKLGALPIGTGNKTERLFGYFTWHADDAPPINPLGDLYKTQVIALAEYLQVPPAILAKPPTADLIVGQTDESDFGITYKVADRILARLVEGYSPEKLLEMGFAKGDIEIVTTRVGATHWKRRLPTVAMLSETAIGEYYLRPVDY